MLHSRGLGPIADYDRLLRITRRVVEGHRAAELIAPRELSRL
jgi:hypothetical protein